MDKVLLIVDDNQADRMAIRRILSKELPDLKIILAESGEEGVEQAGQHNPNIAVLDTNLLGIDGFQTCEKIKSLDYADTKIIIMTGHIDAVDAAKAREMGADDYCVKTADYADIVESVKNLLV